MIECGYKRISLVNQNIYYDFNKLAFVDLIRGEVYFLEETKFKLQKAKLKVNGEVIENFGKISIANVKLSNFRLYKSKTGALNEELKAVQLYDNLVTVTSWGEFFRVDPKGNWVTMSATKSKDTHRIVTFYDYKKGKKQLNKKAHRVFADAFIPNGGDDYFVIAEDGNYSNITTENLHWATRGDLRERDWKNRKDYIKKTCKECGIEKYIARGKGYCKRCDIKVTNRKVTIENSHKELANIDYSKLDDDERDIYNMRKEGATFAEIGEYLGITGVTASNRYIRMRLDKGRWY